MRGHDGHRQTGRALGRRLPARRRAGGLRQRPGAGSLDYYNFTRRVLDILNQGGNFYGYTAPDGSSLDNRFVWTMHNYNDVERDHGAGSIAPDAATYRVGDPNYARNIRRTRRAANVLNAFGWRGWPNATPGVPHIFITEGGADFDRLRTIYPGRTRAALLDVQADLIQRNFNRLTTPGEGYGVDLHTNYLWYSDAPGTSGQTGLLEQILPGPPSGPPYTGGVVRPSYSRWKLYPGRL